MALKSETADVQAALKEIQGVVEDVVIDVSLNASRNLFKETPQVTTFTASNWNPSIGTPDPEVRGVKEARINREKKTAALLKYRLNQGKTFIQNSHSAYRGAKRQGLGQARQTGGICSAGSG